MNLIQIFESKPFQDVGTFNSIFVNTPLIGFSSNDTVEICELGKDNKRRILVNDSFEIFLDITQKKLKEEKKQRIVKQSVKRISLEKKNFSKLYQILTPTQFVLYHAIESVGEIDSIGQLSEATRLERKTVSVNLNKMESMGFIKKTLVDKGNYFFKITIDKNKIID